MDILWKVLLLQIVVIAMICFVLRLLLGRDLWRMAEELLVRVTSEPRVFDQGVTIKTSRPIQKDQRKKFIDWIKKSDPNAEVNFIEDARLRGGVVVSIGGDNYDFSIASRLKALWNK